MSVADAHDSGDKETHFFRFGLSTQPPSSDLPGLAKPVLEQFVSEDRHQLAHGPSLSSSGKWRLCAAITGEADRLPDLHRSHDE
jgi:hypothetical protein